MEYLILIFLHVAVGIFWAGAGVALGLFVLPSVLEAGPAGGAVMAQVAKRRLPLVMTLAGIVVVLTGLRLYMVRFTPGFLMTTEGLVLTLGALFGLGALTIGYFVQRPTAQKLGALSGRIAASGAPPTPDQTREMQDLRRRLRTAGALTAWHLVAASVLMASHRLATTF